MEIVLVIVVLLVIAAAAFVYMRGRPGGVAGLRGGSQAPTLRGSRRARVASRHDPMAVAVERHAQAVEPGDAAREEQNLQAQARRVAADLHARQAHQPDPHQAHVDAGLERTAADPYAQNEPYVDPRLDGGGGSDPFGRPGAAAPSDPYAQPVNADYPAAPPAANGRPLDPDYPAQTADPYARPVDPDYPAQTADPYGRPVDPDYPAQAPDPYAPPPPPPRKRRRFR
ncbi:MAG: hypothetical protein QOD68_3627 [Actinomycetota bacterium]|nr:hypothetical protein [Actinomycetota bacterium]